MRSESRDYSINDFGPDDGQTVQVTVTTQSQSCPSDFHEGGCWDLTGIDSDGNAICNLVAEAKCVALVSDSKNTDFYHSYTGDFSNFTSAQLPVLSLPVLSFEIP